MGIISQQFKPKFDALKAPERPTMPLVLHKAAKDLNYDEIDSLREAKTYFDNSKQAYTELSRKFQEDKDRLRVEFRKALAEDNGEEFDSEREKWIWNHSQDQGSLSEIEEEYAYISGMPK